MNKPGEDRISLRAGRSRNQIPMGKRFSAPVLIGPGAHPASYTIGTGSFPEVKRPGRGIDHPFPSRVEIKERILLYLYSPSGLSWPLLGRTLPFLSNTKVLIFQSRSCAIGDGSGIGTGFSSALPFVSILCGW